MRAGSRRVLIAITSGWSVRNFIRSGLLEQLSKEVEVTVVLPPGDPHLAAEMTELDISVAELKTVIQPRPMVVVNALWNSMHNRRLGLWNIWFWRWSVSIARPRQRLYMWAVRIVSALMRFGPTSQLLRRTYEAWVRSVAAHPEFETIIERHAPDLVVASDSFDLHQVVLAAAARRAGITTLTTVVSWDNLSYKGIPPAPFDRYLVWSDLMKEELLRGDPDIDAGQVIVTGTPQFDFHVREDLIWSREEFCRAVGADPTRKLITYSANTHLQFPFEASVVGRIWESIQDGSIAGDPQFLVRLHPHDDSGQFEQLEERCPGILFCRPWEHSDSRFWWFTPDTHRLALLSNTLRYTDVNITAFTSMILDASILDIPTVCVVFSEGPSTPASEHMIRVPNITHGRYVSQAGATPIAYSFSQLVEFVNSSLERPGADRIARAAMVKHICGPVDGKAADRFLASILEASGCSGDGVTLPEPSFRERRSGVVGGDLGIEP